MATAAATSSAAPASSREDFAKMLEESFTQGSLQEGSVVKGTVVGIEKDLAVIDVGAKTEGRVPLREFAGPGRQDGRGCESDHGGPERDFESGLAQRFQQILPALGPNHISDERQTDRRRQ